MYLHLYVCICLFILERRGERDAAQARGSQREREKSQADSMLSPNPDLISGPWDHDHKITTLAKTQSQTFNKLHHPGAPDPCLLFDSYGLLSSVKNSFDHKARLSLEQFTYFIRKFVKCPNDLLNTVINENMIR